MKKKFLLGILILLNVLLAFSGVNGGLPLIQDPTGRGIGAPLDLLKNAPVKDFFLPGLFIFVAWGITPIVLTILLFIKRRIALKLNMALGVLLMLWIIYELLIMPPFVLIQTAFFVLGLLIFIFALLLLLNNKKGA